MSTDPKKAIPGSSKMREMPKIPGVTPDAVAASAGADGDGPKNTIQNFDKTGIYQQIVAADSAQEVADLENRIELIEAIQRVQLLQTLPETALYFLEQELKFKKFEPKAQVLKIDQNAERFSNMYLLVEGQVMVLGEEGPGRSRVVNILKKGEFFFDKAFRWAGLPTAEVKAIMPTQLLQVEATTLNKIVKVSAGVRKRLKAISLRMDKRAEKFDGNVGRIWNFLVRNGYSYSERVRVIRLDKCIECDACYQGCEARHGHARIWKSKNKFGLLMFPDACRTCEFTHCTAHCPGDHIYFDQIYREVVVKDTCTGCTHCAEDCPYGVIKMVERPDGYVRAEVDVDEVDGIGAKKKKEKEPPPKKGKAAEKEEAPQSDKKKLLAIKCDHCFGHHDMACVTPCPTNAIFDLSQRELFERVDLYGVGGTLPLDEPGAGFRPVIVEKKPFDRGALHAILWSLSLISAAILGWESWARAQQPEWSFSFLIGSHIGITDGEIHPIESVHGFGRWLGWIGSWFLSLALMYVPRKRLEKVLKIWSKAAFLDIHVFLGMMGFVFATYHTTFEVTGNIFAVVFWACAVVVVTGMIGRYFYAQMPRTVAGHEMKLEDAKIENYQLEQQLVAIFPKNTQQFQEYMDWSIPEEKRNRGLIRTVMLMIALDLRRNAKLGKLKGRLVKAGQTSRAAAEIVASIKRKANLEEKILLYEKSQRLTKLWLYVHIGAAILMFVVLAGHIALGVWLTGWT